MTELETYLGRLDDSPLAASMNNLFSVRETLEKLDQPDNFSIESVEREIIGMSPELYAFVFKQAGITMQAEDSISEHLTAAISKLGFDRVKRLIFFHIAFSNDVKASQSKLDRSFAAQLWSLNYRVASTASHWWSQTDPSSADEAFYLGMLQNIGISAFAALEPSKHRSLRLSRREVPLAAKEREHLGTDHYQLGIALIKRWNMPPIHGASLIFEATHGQSSNGFAEENLEDLFSLLYLAKFRAENKKYRSNGLTEEKLGIDPFFNYNRSLLQIATDRLRGAA